MATTSEPKVDGAASTDSREVADKTGEQVERLERELEEVKSFVKYKALLSVMVVSFSLIIAGGLLIALGVFLRPNQTISLLLISFGATILPIGLWGVYFEFSGRRDMMIEIGLKLREVVKTSLEDDVIGRLDDLDSHVRSVKEFELRLREIVREEHAEIRSKLGSLSRLIDSGIVDYEPYGKRLDVLNLLGEAKRTIRVCKTWIPEAEVAAVTQGLQRALGNPSERPEVRILCLDPDSPLAIQRSRDLDHEHETDGRDLIRRGLKAVQDIRREGGWLDSVTIRTYTNLPSVSLYSADETSLVGWYWHSQPAFEGPILRIMGTDYALSREVEKNFEAMWQTAYEYIPNIGDDCILDANLPLPRGVIQELSRIAKVNDAPALDQLRDRVMPQWPELTKLGGDILQRTRHKGYLVVRNFPFNELPPHERRVMFLLLVSFCGTPASHISGKDEFVWDIAPKDTFRQSTYSENSDEAPLHTDSHYRETPEEFIAVLVEQPAKCGGGRTTLLRIAPVLNALRETAEGKECLEILRTQKFPSMIPEIYREGDRNLTESQIIIGNTVRFRPDTIEAGMNGVREYQTGGRLEAFNRFDQAIRQSPDRLSVFLQRGDMLFINNRTALHGRTSFKDKERLLLRVRFNSSS